MPDKQINQLAASLTSTTVTDETLVYFGTDDLSGTPASKKFTLGELRKYINSNTFRFTANNDAGDDAAFATLVTAVNAVGGKIEIEGTALITSAHALTNCHGIKGLPNSLIRFGPSGSITFGTYTNAIASGSTIAIKALSNQRESMIEEDTPAAFSGNVGQGDYVIILADNEISASYARHHATTPQRPLEICRIAKRNKTDTATWDSGKLWLDGFVEDDYTTNPRILVVSPLKNVTVEDVAFTSQNTTQDGLIGSNNSTAFAFHTCVDVNVVNCQNLSPGAGQMVFNQCYRVRVSGCNFEEKLNPEISSSSAGGSGQGYCVSAGVVKHFTLEDSSFGFSRHAFTTTSAPGSTIGVARYGQPRLIMIRNNTCGTIHERLDGPSNVGAAHPPFDTHAEGSGVIFESNLIHLGRSGSGINLIAILSRSRDTIIRNNTIFSPAGQNHKPISSHGPGPVIEGNLIDGNNWMGIELAAPDIAGGFVDGAKIRRNTFRNIGGPAVYVRSGGGSNHEIDSNDFENCAWSFDAPIRIDAGSGHRITNNNIPSASNLRLALMLGSSIAASDIAMLSGNNLDGYAMGTIGVDVNTPAGKELEARWRASNTVDQSIRIHEFDAPDLPAVDSLYAPISRTGAVVDDTTESYFEGVIAGSEKIVDSGNTYSNSTEYWAIASNPFQNNMKVRLTTTGALPTGFATATDYYVVSRTTSSLKLSATVFGSPVSTSDDGTGTHTLTLQADNVAIYRPGTVFLLDDGRLVGSGSYTPGTQDRLYWDTSATDQDTNSGAYTFTQPGDSVLGPVLRILGQVGTNPGGKFIVQVLSDHEILTGAGSPEGSVVASAGQIYLRNDGGAGTTLYVKETGLGSSTGWGAK